jgi:hypothetical protein
LVDQYVNGWRKYGFYLFEIHSKIFFFKDFVGMARVSNQAQS